MNFQRLIIAGNLTANAKRQTSKDGEVSFTTFRVAVSDKKGRSIYFPVTVFGKHGENVAPYLTKGCEVLVEGRIEVNTNGYFSVVADVVRLGNKPAGAKAEDVPLEEVTLPDEELL